MTAIALLLVALPPARGIRPISASPSMLHRPSATPLLRSGCLSTAAREWTRIRPSPARPGGGVVLPTRYLLVCLLLVRRLAAGIEVGSGKSTHVTSRTSGGAVWPVAIYIINVLIIYIAYYQYIAYYRNCDILCIFCIFSKWIK